MSLSAELDLDVPFKDLRHEAVLNIVHTANLFASIGAGLFREHGLTEAQFNVLFALKYAKRNVTQSDLGKRLVVTRATITSVLDKLEEKGLVERLNVPGNRRIYHVALTPEGRRMIEKVEPVYRRKVHRVLVDFSEKDCATLIHTLERVRARAGVMRHKAAID